MEGNPNPFAPPRTTDLEEGVGPAGTGTAISEQAVRELVAAVPWTAWLVRLTALSIPVAVLGTIASFVRPRSQSEPVTTAVTVLLSSAISVLFLVILRGLVREGRRLAAGQRSAVAGVIAAQRSYLKTIGVLVIAAIVIGGLVVLVAMAIAVSRTVPR